MPSAAAIVVVGRVQRLMQVLKQGGRPECRPLIAAEWTCSPLHVAEEWLSMALYRWSLGQNSPY